MEIGCGYGCSIFPLLQGLSRDVMFIATDFSEQALLIFQQNPLFDNTRISVSTYDSTIDPQQYDNLASLQVDIVLCVFVISAIEPHLHQQCFVNIHSLMKDGGYLLFRDYAEYDMTMFRHPQRLGEKLFRRNDGTLVYYFNESDIQLLAAATGFEVIELFYATVAVSNRKSKVTMKRVFLHAVLKKKTPK
jgi:SAM-dependent methyltransferase